MLIGDAKETLRALIPHLIRKEDRAWRETIEKDVRRWWKIVEKRALQDADPMNPQRVAHELSERAAGRRDHHAPTPARPRTGTRAR